MAPVRIFLVMAAALALGACSSSKTTVSQNETPREMAPGPGGSSDTLVANIIEPSFDYADLEISYPDEARKNSIEGRVLVKAFIEPSGRATKVEIIESDNEVFNQAALDAIREVTFKPATQNGVPIGAWATIPLIFRLN
jgi:TonB family protein